MEDNNREETSYRAEQGERGNVYVLGSLEFSFIGYMILQHIRGSEMLSICVGSEH